MAVYNEWDSLESLSSLPDFARRTFFMSNFWKKMKQEQLNLKPTNSTPGQNSKIFLYPKEFLFQIIITECDKII